MAARTFTSAGANNLWSNPLNWDGGASVPADGDDCTIPLGEICEFDADHSGFVTGVKVTITGTLSHTITSGSYYLKTKALESIVGTGTWNVGTSASPIPFETKHTINILGYATCTSLAVNIFGEEPQYTYVRLSGSAAAGQTEIPIDTDITGDIWAPGDNIYIANIGIGKSIESATIAEGGISGSAITITSGLTASKLNGSFIALINRNVKILGTSEALRYMYNGNIGGGEFDAQAAARTFKACTPNITGGIFHKASYTFVDYRPGTIISGGVFANTTLNAAVGATITGGLFIGNYQVVTGTVNEISGGIFGGNQYIFGTASYSQIWGGTFIGATNIVYSCNNIFINGTNCTFSNISVMVNRSIVNVYLRNVDFTGANTEFTQYTNYILCYASSINHNQIVGNNKFITAGAITVTQSSIVPDGYSQCYISPLISSTIHAHYPVTINLLAGKSVSIDLQLRKDTSMEYLPRFYLVVGKISPKNGFTPLDTFQMTDSTDTWETDTFTLSNTSDYDEEYTLWFFAKNATGNVYSAYSITDLNGGGGSVKILPVMGRVGL